MPGRYSERAVILAPTGRDAAVASGLIQEAGFQAETCADFATLLAEIKQGVGVAVLADEAIKTIDLRPIGEWLANQPSWSDLPIVLLTRQGGGPERNPDAARLAQLFGNVTFIERPFHPTTLISIIRSAVRGRRRQYEARAILEDLSESRGLLETALDAGRLGSWQLTLSDLKLEASDSCKSFFGRSPADPFEYEDLRRAVHPDDLQRWAKVVEETIAVGGDLAIEYRNVWPDGTVHWVDIRGRLVRSAFGQPQSLVGVSSDITDRKQSDIERETLLSQLAAERSALAELTESLERRVDERSEALMSEVAARERAQDQLRQAQKMEAIGQLTGGVAHDFNNLLMAVMGNLELLKKRIPDEPRLMRLVDGAMQGAARGASLTQRLLAFARRQDLQAEATDLGKLLYGMNDLLMSSLGPRIDLQFDIAEDLPAARIDANQLELAVLNLAINARDAMADGGPIRIALSELNGDGKTSKPGAGRYLKISVIDRGAGMSPETLAKAIDPFFSTKAIGKGTGLGLSMVHGLAQQLGGTLELSSQLGQGTTAALILPASDEAPHVVHVEADESHAIGSATILVVDDDPLIAMSTVEMLEDLGHRVISASSGKEALDIVQSSEPIDLMMTDHMMPGMTGTELANRTKAVRPSMPILLATGYAEMPEAAHSDLPRLTKPYHQDQLRLRLAQMLKS